MSIFFLRGVFGSGQPPIPVPDDELKCVEAAVERGSDLIEISGYSMRITLLADADEASTTFQYATVTMAALMIRNHYIHKAATRMMVMIGEYDEVYTGKTYIIHRVGMNVDRSSVQLLLNKYEVDNWIMSFNAIRAVDITSTFLTGSHSGGDLCEIRSTLQDVMHAHSGKTVIWLHGAVGYNFTNTISTFIVGNCVDRITRTIGIVIPTPPTPKTIAKLTRSLRYFNSRIYVFSVDAASILPRIHAAHVRALVPALMTQEQADIHIADAPDDDAVTYDDGNGDGDSDTPIYAD